MIVRPALSIALVFGAGMIVIGRLAGGPTPSRQPATAPVPLSTPPAETVLAGTPAAPASRPASTTTVTSNTVRGPSVAASRPAPAPAPKHPPQRLGLAGAWVAAGARGIVGPPPVALNAGRGATPVRIEIPSIGVSTAIDPMGLNRDGTMEVPRNFARAGWYTGRPVPGDIGPAIIVAHIDGRSGPAAFYRLRDLRPGAGVHVSRADRSVVSFTVERTRQVPKDAFPTDEVYGPTPAPTLRLITCGGGFDHRTGHYRDNTVVFLRMET